jgi:predicted ATPase/class 3 adenylate cyclase
MVAAMNRDPSAVTTFLFTDIEDSTRLWEQDAARMGPALASHDAICRAAAQAHRGRVVKMTGDGMHSAFDDPLDAVAATLDLQQALADPAATNGVALRVRCGLHVGFVERRDNDYFGSAVNRAARIMSAAYGGQILLSGAVAALVEGRLPPGVGLRDLGLVRLRDLASPERMYQVTHVGLRAEFPPLRSLEGTPNNLPQQVTSFIGRESESAEVKAMLAGNRLVTLLGVGGIGKSRLSLQVAADVLDDYPDGVWFVELAPIADEVRVPQVVATVLGVSEEAGKPLVDVLVRALRHRRLLLVLDNCEHLAAACADLVARLLQSGPHVKVLASSREPLNLRGEITYPVPAMGLPDRSNRTTSTPTQFEAVRLFAERAAGVDPAFEITLRNADIVVDICRRLDGIPLAIELAAARVRGLSVEQISARLDDRFRLLVRGDRTALPRQQTLRALIDWSYDLLDERERALFRRLSVFAGGWTLEAAEAVCAEGDVDAGDVLDVQSQLVDKSLVVLDSERARYAFLDTVRQYAAERLTESTDGDGARSRHLAFYLQLAEKAAAELLGSGHAGALQRLDVELENILAAHGGCQGSADAVEHGYRLAYSMKHYWFMRGLLNLGHRVTVEAVSRRSRATTDIARCKTLWAAGQICSRMGRYAEAQGFLEEGLSGARGLDDRQMVAAVLNTLAWVSLGRGDRATARSHCEEALDMARRSGNKRQIASASNALAQVHRLNGDLESAAQLYEQFVLLARELHDSEGIAVGLLNLAMVAISHGFTERARALLLEVFAIAVETGSKLTVQSALEVSAGLAAASREWERAARFYGVAESQTGITGAQRDPADAAFLDPLIAQARRELGDQGFDKAKASGLALPSDEAVASARAWLAAP